MLTEGFLKVINELLHLLLGVGREVFLNVKLTDGFAQHGVGHVKRVFPARHLHLLARHGSTVHVEVCVGEGIAQVRRCGINILEDEILLQIIELEALDHLVDLG